MIGGQADIFVIHITAHTKNVYGLFLLFLGVVLLSTRGSTMLWRVDPLKRVNTATALRLGRSANDRTSQASARFIVTCGFGQRIGIRLCQPQCQATKALIGVTLCKRTDPKKEEKRND